jgi:hypothetical protein
VGFLAIEGQPAQPGGAQLTGETHGTELRPLES